MAAASQKAGHRLVDVLDLHWYPEATGDHRITSAEATTAKDKTERLQTTRTLWDKEYKENSWIAQWHSSFLPLLPKVQASIDRYYPDTRIAFTEFQFGGYEDISGTIALADALGIFGKYGVYASNHWGHPGSYGLLAYNLYCDYDGNGSAFGDMAVQAEVKYPKYTSVYASRHSRGSGELHLVVTNKYPDTPISGEFIIDSSTRYRSAKVYLAEGEKAEIQPKGEVALTDNRLVYSLPVMSVAHIVLVPE